MFVVLGYLLIAALAAALPCLTYANCSSRLGSLRLVLFNAPFADYRRLPRVHLRLLLSFFSLFLFFNLIFFGCFITTDNVTVPTDKLVDSTAKLIATSKTLAFRSNDLDLIRMAPDGSFLKRLSEKNTFLIKRLGDFVRMQTSGINNFIILDNEISLVYYMNILGHARNRSSVAFLPSTDYYESLVVFLMRRSLGEERKRFIKSRRVICAVIAEGLLTEKSASFKPSF